MKRRGGQVLTCCSLSHKLSLLMQWEGAQSNAKLDRAAPHLLFGFNSGDSGSHRAGLVF